MRHRKTPITHTVRAHVRNGKTVRSYPRGEGERRQRVLRVVSPSASSFRFGAQMNSTLRSLSHAEKGLTLTDLILLDQQLKDVGSGDGKLRLTSGVADKTVRSPNMRAMITFAIMENTYPEIKESPLAKQVRGNVEKNQEAKREADKLYASYSRTVKHLLNRGLITSTYNKTTRKIVYEGEGGDDYDPDLKYFKEMGLIPQNAHYKTTSAPAQGRKNSYFITDKGRRLLNII